MTTTTTATATVGRAGTHPPQVEREAPRRLRHLLEPPHPDCVPRAAPERALPRIHVPATVGAGSVSAAQTSSSTAATNCNDNDNDNDSKTYNNSGVRSGNGEGVGRERGTHASTASASGAETRSCARGPPPDETSVVSLKKSVTCAARGRGEGLPYGGPYGEGYCGGGTLRPCTLVSAKSYAFTNSSMRPPGAARSHVPAYVRTLMARRLGRNAGLRRARVGAGRASLPGPVQTGRTSLSPRPVQTGRASLSPRPVQTGRTSLNMA
jgi:hypothetical protein